MTGLDWIVVALVALLALHGFAQGLVVGALTFAGFAGGALLGSRVAPGLLDEGARSPYAPVLALAGAVLGGAALSTALQTVGRRVRGALRPTDAARRSAPVLLLDGLLGAVFAGLVGLALAWVVGAVVLQSPVAPGLRRDVQRSLILGAVNEVVPPRTVLNALARLDPLPALAGPAVTAGEPPSRAAVARDPQVRAAAGSVVRVTGTACGLGVVGSGWVAGDGVVVTNAHVVAGQDDTRVRLRGTGPPLAARAAVFDPGDDVAVLRVPGLDAPALALAADPRPGVAGAILGFPGGGPADVRPARLGATATVRARDAYGTRPVRRRVTGLRGLVRSGNSGGPVVDRRGRVLTTVFAVGEGTGRRSGYGVPNDVVRAALDRAGGRADTGPCTR